MDPKEIDAMLAEWDANADAAIAAAFIRGGADESERFIDLATSDANWRRSDEELEELARQLGADLRRVRGSC